MATRAKPPKNKILKKRSAPKAFSAPPPPPPSPTTPDPSLREMQAQAVRAAANRRVAAFMERTANLQWMRSRFGSFEEALLGGLRNLLDEANKDETESRSSESFSAHYTFLYGLFTSLQHLFFWKALDSRVEDIGLQLHRSPEKGDVELVMRELEVFNSAASRDDVQARLRKKLSAAENDVVELRKRVMEQAKAYDILNMLKDMPKA